MRRALLVCALALVAGALPRPAQALPEIYAGAGLHRFGLDKVSGGGNSLAVSAGVDDLLKGFGVGLNAYVPGADVVVNADLRYSILKVPFLRIFAGIGAGAQRTTAELKATTTTPKTSTTSWGTVLEGFVGARVSFGTYFVGLDVGGARWASTQPYGILTVGLTL